MKKFSAFLSEASASRAQQMAKAMGLKHVGYGFYANPATGEVTHKSRGGELVELSPEEKKSSDPKSDDTVVDGKTTETQDAKTIAITFGRFNPPTVGHKKLIDRVKAEAKGGEYRIYPSQTTDPQKNPLSPSEKVKYMKMAYPQHADYISTNTKLRTIFDVLTSLYDDGYTDVTIIVGGDRVSEFKSLALKYNGQLYDFNDIIVTSAGDRDPDADGVEGMSASKMRAAAAEGDFETFKKGIPNEMGLKDKERLFKAIRSGMQLESVEDFCDASYQLYEIAPKLDLQGLREAYLNKELFSVGTFVENLNTGVIGKIVSRGSNHVIYIDENDNIYRAWLKDLIERIDIKLFDFTPAGEMGTDQLADYVKRLTPGEFVRKINKRKKHV